MNSQIVVIEHVTSYISSKLKCNKLEYNNQSKDEDIHRWLIANKQSLKNASKLIIPVRLGDEDAEYMGLYIGLHIRLTKELEDVRYLPILFVTDDTKEEILYNQINNQKEKSGLLLFTKGSYLLSSFSLDEFILKSLLPISEKILLESVVPALSIETSKDPGHQLANDWGAFRLAKFAGHSLRQEKPTSLYFKYKDSFTNNETVPELDNKIGVLNESCKALLIDDNADSGWAEILKYILKNKIVMPGKASSLDVIKAENEAMSFNNYDQFDIVFLDLRLSKEEDRRNHINKIEEFSGTRVLKKIMSINRGIQVIIFTASNKVWNIEKLLDLGANGYYIKESPEYILSPSFSKENYLELLATIRKTLALKFLRKVDNIHRKCLNTITTDRPSKPTIYQQFYDRTTAAFEIAYQLLGKTVVDGKYLNFTFLTYFQIIEDYVSQRENFEFVSKRDCYVGPLKTKVIDDSTGSLIWKLTFVPDKTHGDYFEIRDEVKAVETQIQTLAKVSFVLAFNFYKDNSYLKKWARLNNVRNIKAGHGGANGYVTSTDIEEILEIIELIIS
jgi:CheY-like chemotaxis protein